MSCIWRIGHLTRVKAPYSRNNGNGNNKRRGGRTFNSAKRYVGTGLLLSALSAESGTVTDQRALASLGQSSHIFQTKRLTLARRSARTNSYMVFSNRGYSLKKGGGILCLYRLPGVYGRSGLNLVVAV